MGQQSAPSQESERLRSSPRSQRTHVRFTTSALIDSMRRPNVNTFTSIHKPPASRGNAANRRLSQTRSNLKSSQQRLEEQRIRRTSQFFNLDSLSQQSVNNPTQDSLHESSQDEEDKGGRPPLTSGRRSGRRASASPGKTENSTTPSKSRQLDAFPNASLKSVSPQLETQEWPTQKLSISDEDDSGEEQEVSAPQDTASRLSPQKATRYYTQSPSPSPRRSPFQPTAQLSQLNESGTHMPSIDPKQQQPSSADSLGFSQLVCGQRMPTLSPTPNARPSTQTQPYDDFDYDAYQEDLSDYYDENNNDRNTVAEDSLAASSGEVLSWSVTPQSAVGVGSVEVEVKAKQEGSHSDQEGIIASTFPHRRSESHSQSGAEESDEERFEQRAGSILPEVESEGHADTGISKQPPSSSPQKSDNIATRRTEPTGKRDHERREPVPDDVKQQLDDDTLDLLSHNPSIRQVFLCVEIPHVPEFTGSMSKTAVKTMAPRSGRKRVAEGSPKQKTRTNPPSLQPPPKQIARRPIGQKHTNAHRGSSRHGGPHQPGTYYEARTSDYNYDDEEEEANESEDKSGSDEQEVGETPLSINPRPIGTQLLPPKKRIRNNVSFQEDILQLSQEQEHIQHGPKILHDSDSDEEQVPRNGQRRKRHVGGVGLASVSPSLAQEQEYELEQDQVQDEQRSPSPSPPRSDQEDEATLHQPDEVWISDNKEQGQGRAQRWEITKLHQVWKEHDVRWPFNTVSGRGGDRKAEEYSPYFVFGSALPFPK